MKNSTVRAGPKSNRKIVDKDEIDTPNTQIHDGSLHWLGYNYVSFISEAAWAVDSRCSCTESVKTFPLYAVSPNTGGFNLNVCVMTNMWKNLHDRIYSLRGLRSTKLD
jgi:hypothetical protein